MDAEDTKLTTEVSRSLKTGSANPADGLGRTEQRWLWIALVIAAALRLAAASGDLAIDEIWSLTFVKLNIRRVIDILALRHDNNHPLNTFFMYLVGPNRPGICYRIPAVIASLGTVWLAGLLALRRGGITAAVIAWILTGTSYLLILYGTEARGYSYLVFFGYLAWWCLLRVEDHRRWIDVAAFTVAVCLGFLSHLTFLYCYAGLFAWTIWKWLQRPNWLLALAHIPSLLFAAALYVLFVDGMMLGGGTEIPISTTLISTLSIFAGGPQFGDGALVVALFVGVLLTLSLLHLGRSDLATAGGLLMIVVVMPTVVMIGTGPRFVYPRYFLIPVAFALLLACEALSDLWRARRMNRAIAVVLICLFVGGNAWWNIQLLDHGRGDYSAALHWMGSQPSDHVMVVTSDHDFRNGMIADYYLARLWPENAPLRYLPQPELTPEGADWVIRHNFDGDKPFPTFLSDRFGTRYRLERTYQHHSLTGWNWWIYRRFTE